MRACAVESVLKDVFQTVDFFGHKQVAYAV